MVLFFPLSPSKTGPSRVGGRSAGKMDRFGYWNNSKMAKLTVHTLTGGKTEKKRSKNTTYLAECMASGQTGMKTARSNSSKPSDSAKLRARLPDGIKTERKRMIRSMQTAKSFQWWYENRMERSVLSPIWRVVMGSGFGTKRTGPKTGARCTEMVCMFWNKISLRQ